MRDTSEVARRIPGAITGNEPSNNYHNMKKLFTLIMLFASICMSAQTLEGDVNKDGKLTIEDVTKVIDLYLNYEEPSNADDKEQGPNLNGHECVDLGLPSGTLWATCNVGASSPEEYGDYFAWGETAPKSEYKWGTYKWCNGSGYTMTKYCAGNNYGNPDNRSSLDLEDDAAHVNWGGDWRMPTREEQEELRSQCTWIWTTMNGTNGYKIVGPNENSIFFPAAGVRSLQYLKYAGTYGCHWSSTLYLGNLSQAFQFAFDHSFATWQFDNRYIGQSVRPVCK